MQQIPTIFDTDPGIDDAFALSFLHASPIFDVKMISTVAGNVVVENTTKNARGLVKAMDWDVPIYKGSCRAINGDRVTAEAFHGVDGLSGFIFDDADLATLKEGSAVDAIIKTLEENTDVLIIAVGPLTNIATVLMARPDLKKNIKEITIMGGGVGMGNTTAAAEFNIFADPEAASIVFESGVPINMAGLNVTTQTCYDIEMHKLFKASDKKINQILADIMDRRIAKTGAEENYTTFMHDTVAVMYHTHREIFKTERVHIDIETKGEFTRGMTVADLRPIAMYPKNVNFIKEIDSNKFREAFLEVLL